MGHLNMIRQGLQSTKEKPFDTDLEDKITTDVLYFTTVEPSTTKEVKIYADVSPTLQAGKKIDDKAKNISSNRHEILLGQRQNPTNHFQIFWEEGKKTWHTMS